MELHDSIVRAGDLRQPVNFNEQMMQNSRSILDQEVGQSLIQLLSSRKTSQIDVILEEEEEVIPAPGGEANHDPVSAQSEQDLMMLTRQMPDEVSKSVLSIFLTTSCMDL